MPHSSQQAAREFHCSNRAEQAPEYFSLTYVITDKTMATLRLLVKKYPIRSQTCNQLMKLSTTRVQESSSKVNLFDLNFDRRIKIDYKDSINYMNSEAYKKTYKDNIIWKLYKRNHKAQFPSLNTRPNCLNEHGFLDTSYPCPICRDEYLVLHPDNTKLLIQFIDPYTGEIVTPDRHGLCLKQYRNLIIAIHRAKDIGSLTFELPDRLYDYKEYYKQ